MLRHLLCALALILTFAAGTAYAGRPISLLDDLVPGDGIKVSGTDVRHITSPDKDGAEIRTTRQFKAPLIITAVVRDDSLSLRLCYGQFGRVLLNWEDDGNKMVYQQTDDVYHYIDGKGPVPRDRFVTVQWILKDGQARILVDGVERAAIQDPGKGPGTVGFQFLKGGAITLRSLAVTPLSEDEADNGPTLLGEKIDVTFPTTPKAEQDAGSPPPNPSPDAIARPEWRTKAKPIVRDMASVSSMSVLVGADGEQSGVVMNIIAMVPPVTRTGTTAGVGFARIDGDEDMKVSFDEAMRAVALRYPYWAPGHIDISFGDKYTSHTGPSAGCAFALLGLSMLEGFDIDPGCAVTGDLTVDWRVREVGGINAKLHGATLDGCHIAVIPAGNAPAVDDLPLFYGRDALWKIQVFTADRLQDVVELARRDRPSALQEAIAKFDDLARKLESSPSALRAPATRAALKEILELAPNHLSARCLLDYIDGKASRTLSYNGTLYRLGVAYYPFEQMLNSGEPLDTFTISPAMTTLVRRRLSELRPIANPKLQPLVADFAAFVGTAQAYAARRATPAQLIAAGQRIDARLTELHSDPGYLDKLIREGY